MHGSHQQCNTHPGDMSRLLSKRRGSVVSKKKLTARVHNVKYHVLANKKMCRSSTLVYRGANGSLCRSNMRPIKRYIDRKVDISVIDDHEITDRYLGQQGGVIRSNLGDIIVIVNNGTECPNHNSILSSVQLEAHGCKVGDQSPTFYSNRTITTPEGHIFPMTFTNGFLCLDIGPFTHSVWKELPHVFVTGEQNWDPSCADHIADGSWYKDH